MKQNEAYRNKIKSYEAKWNQSKFYYETIFIQNKYYTCVYLEITDSLLWVSFIRHEKKKILHFFTCAFVVVKYTFKSYCSLFLCKTKTNIYIICIVPLMFALGICDVQLALNTLNLIAAHEYKHHHAIWIFIFYCKIKIVQTYIINLICSYEK